MRVEPEAWIGPITEAYELGVVVLDHTPQWAFRIP